MRLYWSTPVEQPKHSLPSSDYNGVPITVDVSCAGTCGPVTVQQDLSGVPDCSTASSSQTFTTYPFQFTTALCAAGTHSPSLSSSLHRTVQETHTHTHTLAYPCDWDLSW